MKVENLLVVVMALFASLPAMAAPTSCQQQLAEKDKLISQLTETISNLSSRSSSGPVSVTVQTPWTCEAICLENMIGTGFRHPGEMFRLPLTTTNTDPAVAWKELQNQCEADVKETYENHKDSYSSTSDVAGYVTKAEMNSEDWESKMVKSFNADPAIRKFCFNR
jgi:hypothetical protein